MLLVLRVASRASTAHALARTLFHVLPLHAGAVLQQPYALLRTLLRQEEARR